MSEIWWWNTDSTRSDAFWTPTGSGFTNQATLPTKVPWERHWAITGHFDGDNAADILFYEPGAGTDHLYWGVDVDG